MDGSDLAYWNQTLVFDPALEWQGKTYDQLKLREPTYGEVLEAKRRGDDGDLYLASTLSGVPLQALVKAPASVMFEAAEIISRFLDKRQLRRGAT